jgi:hypothetical protein
MPFRHPLPIALALFTCCATAVPTVAEEPPDDAQITGPPGPAKAWPAITHPVTTLPENKQPATALPAPEPPATTGPVKILPLKTHPAAAQPAAPDPKIMRPMVFYDAHGEPDSCGPGCSEWIAAEGKIDADTASRLQRLLVHLRGARPPIFFHSPGGSVNGAIALGRLIRAHKMTVSVGHTIPLECDDGASGEKSCAAEIRAGDQIESALDHQNFMCNSGCVYALAGGTTRLIPPFAALGIHDVGLMRSAKQRRVSARAVEYAKAMADGRLRNYMREMGIGEGLLTEAFAIPFSTVKPLRRSDAARFGLDPREFGETAWYFSQKIEPVARKLFFLRTALDQPHYINGLINLACGKGTNSGYYILAYGREHLNSDALVTPAAAPPIDVSVNAKQYRFYRQPNDKFFVRSVRLPPAELDAISDMATIVLPGTDFGRQGGPAGDVKLGMAGFATAVARLRRACAL